MFQFDVMMQRLDVSRSFVQVLCYFSVLSFNISMSVAANTFFCYSSFVDVDSFYLHEQTVYCPVNNQNIKKK